MSLLPVRPARESDLPAEAPDLRHALATDPEGLFAAGADGTVLRTAGSIAGKLG